MDGVVMICLLTHKITRALETEGLAEARMLLQVIVSIQWFWKVNFPTKSSTYCLLLLIEMTR